MIAAKKLRWIWKICKQLLKGKHRTVKENGWTVKGKGRMSKRKGRTAEGKGKKCEL